MAVSFNAFGKMEWLNRRLLVLTLVALAARCITFGNPVLDADESFYLVTAQSMLHGALPYVDIWDRKPVGLFLIYLLPALFKGAGAYIAYQLLALLFVIVTGLLIARLAERAGWRAGALPAALAYILWINLADGQGGQAPVFYNLFMAGAALAVTNVMAEARPGRRLACGLAAMLLTGISLQIKYTVVFEGVFFGSFLLFQEWRLKTHFPRIIFRGVILAATALIPTAIVTAVYAGLGYFDAFFFANFISIWQRHAEPFNMVAGNFGVIAAILGPLLAIAYWRLPPVAVTPVEGEAGQFLKFWLASALFGLLIFGTYFVHYSLAVMVPAACCAAGFFAHSRHGRKTAIIVLTLIAIAGQVMVAVKIKHRGNGDEIRAIAHQIGRGEGCLFDYSGQTILYQLTGRCWPSKYMLSSHLNHARETGAIGVSQEAEMRRILESRPEVILMTPQGGENMTIHRMVYSELARAYHLEATLPLGRGRVEIFRRNEAGGNLP
jgi:hypothetical protein